MLQHCVNSEEIIDGIEFLFGSDLAILLTTEKKIRIIIP